MNYNAIPPFAGAIIKDLHESIGVTQQPVGTDDTWSQTIGGLIFQGGKSEDIVASGFQTIFYFPAFPKKVLGIFAQTIGNIFPAPAIRNHYVNPVDLTKFDLLNDYPTGASAFYWWAIGY